jgi:signal peptidase I
VYYIKRVIGLPGETIYINEKGNVYIDGVLLKEDYIKDITTDPGIAGEPFALKEGEYFVMGDNRNNSTDSRSPSIGVVRKEEMVGRAFMRIWPITDIKILKH